MSWRWPAKARPDRGDREGFRDQRVVSAELAGQGRCRGRPCGPVDHRESAELRELKRRNRLLEQENEVLRRAAAYLSQANLPGK